MLIPALLFCILASGFFNPKANLAGVTTAQWFPLIGTIALAGAHPLALLRQPYFRCVFGLILSFLKGGSKLVNLTLKVRRVFLAHLLGSNRNNGAQINSIQAFWAVGLQSDTVAAGSMGYIGLIVLSRYHRSICTLAKVKQALVKKQSRLCFHFGLAIALVLTCWFRYYQIVTETGIPKT